MGKTASIKHNPLSKLRSRASRRQTSPSINADKSLKEISPPTREANILAPRPNAGVSKSLRKGGKTQKSSRQKQRDAKRQDRAEAVMSKMEVKVGLKVKKSKVINERKGEWGVVNGEGREARRAAIFGGGGGGKGGEEGEEDGWRDVEEEGKQQEEEEEEGKMEEVVVHDGVGVVSGEPVLQPELPVTTSTGIEDETVEEGDKIT